MTNEPIPLNRPSGKYAKYQGTWYRARIREDDYTIMLEARTDTLPPGFTLLLPGRYILDVDQGDLEELVKVRASCMWRGERYGIYWIDDEVVIIVPAGRVDGPRLKALGFVDTLGYGSLNKQVPITEVSDIHEEVTDLLHRDQ